MTASHDISVKVDVQGLPVFKAIVRALKVAGAALKNVEAEGSCDFSRTEAECAREEIRRIIERIELPAIREFE